MKIKEKISLLRSLFCFGEVAKGLSITKAADVNGMKQSNYSREIKKLEDFCGGELFTRERNKMLMNESGKNLYEYFCNLEKVVHNLENFKVNAHCVCGDINLWTSDGLGANYVSSCLPGFYLKYPDVRINIICSDSLPDVTVGIDMFIVYEKPDANPVFLVSEHELKFGLFADQKYLLKYGYPKNLSDIQENHKICNRSNYADVWEKWRDFLLKSKRVVAETNSSSMLLRMTKDGIGISLHPLGTNEREESLVYLDKINFVLRHKFWIVARKDSQNSTSVKALMKYIKNAVML